METILPKTLFEGERFFFTASELCFSWSAAPSWCATLPRTSSTSTISTGWLSRWGAWEAWFLLKAHCTTPLPYPIWASLLTVVSHLLLIVNASSNTFIYFLKVKRTTVFAMYFQVCEDLLYYLRLVPSVPSVCKNFFSSFFSSTPGYPCHPGDVTPRHPSCCCCCRLLQMIIRKIRPLANDHLGGPAIFKWSSGGSGFLKMIIRHLYRVPDLISWTFLKQFLLVSKFSRGVS